MSDGSIGKVGWVDLTVPDAEAVRDFYQAVVGWQSQPHAMDGYDDFVMVTPAGEGVAGVCHARGPNADLPPVWLIYVTVEDLDASLEQVKARGGRIVSGPRGAGGSDRYCVIADPAGATLALYQRGAGPDAS